LHNIASYSTALKEEEEAFLIIDKVIGGSQQSYELRRLTTYYAVFEIESERHNKRY
jgi:hypothetical protein